MATEIVIPTVGESVTSGVVAAWTVAEGEWVERDATVLELETDKITMEIPAPASGVVKHAAAEGDTVDVGAVVGTVDESADKPSGGSGEQSASAEAGGSGSTERPASAPAATKEREEPKAAANGSPSSTNGSPAAKPAGITDADVRATPLAKKLAEEGGVNLRTVHGTGPGGKVREQDVLAIMQGDGGADVAGASGSDGNAASRGTTVEAMSPLRQRIATRLVQAQQTAAMLTTFNEVDMGPVMELRKQHKEAFAEKHGIGLGFMSFFTKAAASALRAFPMVNAYIVEGQGGKPAVQKHEYCDIAIAVSSPKGLVVPVLRNVERMSFAGVESTIKDYATRAKDGKLGLDEMQGGTFTITNGGIFGSLMSTPILNPPQSAILGMHTIKGRPMEYPAKSGQMAVRPMMYLALSYDHRIVDGAEAVQFLVHIKDAIEDPTRLLLEI